MGLALYSAIGSRLTHYDVDVERATLAERRTLQLPVGVQYAWRHASKPLLYVACSDGGLGATGSTHVLCTLEIDRDGGLSTYADAIPLRWRPVHVTTDGDSRHVLVTYNDPSRVDVWRIGEDGIVGDAIAQPELRMGKTAHQARVTPANDRVIVPVRGTDPGHGRPEDPGSIEVFDYRDGRLAHRQSIAPDGGFGFGPRHVDFHPTRPWMYLSIERQDQIAQFTLDGTVEGPAWRKSTLAGKKKERQLGGAIHVHPNGRFVYVSNRADGTVELDGQKVFNDGENTIAAFAIDERTGEPNLVQIEDTRGIHVRTFSIDPSGRLLVAGNMRTRKVRDASGRIADVPGGLSVFRIGDDGRLAFVRKVDADVTRANLFWLSFAAR